LILKKISKLVATGCQILRLKCTNSISAEAPPPDSTGRACSASPDPIAVFKRPASKGRGWKGEGRGTEGGGMEGEDEGEEQGKGEGRDLPDFLYARLQLQVHRL